MRSLTHEPFGPYVPHVPEALGRGYLGSYYRSWGSGLGGEKVPTGRDTYFSAVCCARGTVIPRYVGIVCDITAQPFPFNVWDGRQCHDGP